MKNYPQAIPESAILTDSGMGVTNHILERKLLSDSWRKFCVRPKNLGAEFGRVGVPRLSGHGPNLQHRKAKWAASSQREKTAQVE